MHCTKLGASLFSGSEDDQRGQGQERDEASLNSIGRAGGADSGFALGMTAVCGSGGGVGRIFGCLHHVPFSASSAVDGGNPSVSDEHVVASRREMLAFAHARGFATIVSGGSTYVDIYSYDTNKRG